MYHRVAWRGTIEGTNLSLPGGRTARQWITSAPFCCSTNSWLRTGICSSSSVTPRLGSLPGLPAGSGMTTFEKAYQESVQSTSHHGRCIHVGGAGLRGVGSDTQDYNPRKRLNRSPNARDQRERRCLLGSRGCKRLCSPCDHRCDRADRSARCRRDEGTNLWRGGGGSSVPATSIPEPGFVRSEVEAKQTVRVDDPIHRQANGIRTIKGSVNRLAADLTRHRRQRAVVPVPKVLPQ
jgi:hypothetical protein